MSRFITLTRASEVLGIAPSTMHGKNGLKYKEFIYDTNGREKKFDINSYLTMEERNHRLTMRCQLLTEYIKHMNIATYTDIANISRTSNKGTRSVSHCSYGYKSACKIWSAISEHYPVAFAEFHDYYDFQIPDTHKKFSKKGFKK